MGVLKGNSTPNVVFIPYVNFYMKREPVLLPRETLHSHS